MIHCKKFIKIIAVLVIIVFIFQSDIFLYSQKGRDLLKQFQKAKNAYINGHYDDSKKRIERIIGIISDKSLDRKDILGKCFLLLGAICEKKGDLTLAEANYRKAKEEYDIQTLDGVDLENLTIYKKVIKGEKGKIEKEGIKRKKKFPWLLVAGGVVIVVVAAILLLKKKKYTLTVTRGEGVDGDPASGTYKYKEGKYVNYSYTAQSGYTEVVVRLDGDVVDPSGTITMNANHTLTATASRAHTLTVTKGTGVDGSPDSGTTTHAQGSTVDYSYSLQSGYSNLVVTLDDVEVSSSGSITMDSDHTLTANATANVVSFDTDKEVVIIDEGSTSTLGVRLTAQPTGDVQVTVNRSSGDEDIRVVSGENLTFTTSDWNEYQQVTLEAVEDDDMANGRATIRISADGVTDKDIEVVEDDKGCELAISIIYPANYATVSGTVTIQTKISGNCVIDKVEFYVGNELIETVSSSPYSFIWDTSKYLTGSYDIRVKAYSTTGKTANAQINVTVTR